MPAAFPATLLRRDRAIVLGGLALLGALAWAYLLRLSVPMAGPGIDAGGMDGAMAMPGAPGWPGTELLLAFLMWVVMMVAMMTPGATPLLLTVAAVSRQRQPQHPPAAISGALFTGYLLVWTGFSLAAALLQWGLQSTILQFPALLHIRPLGAGVLLLVAGAYQFTPLKDACLSRCRTPLGFVLAEWRDGSSGALVMGLRHGLYCVGCCWLFMALLFVVGVMNLLWVALIAATVLLEKVVPGGRGLSRAIGVLLVVWGVRTLLPTM